MSLIYFYHRFLNIILIYRYLKKIKLPRLTVIKNWCLKILEGVSYLHKRGFVHGKLTCESIYINSNNGDIKIGDLGIRAIPSYNNSNSFFFRFISKSRILWTKLMRFTQGRTVNLEIRCFLLWSLNYWDDLVRYEWTKGLQVFV